MEDREASRRPFHYEMGIVTAIVTRDSNKGEMEVRKDPKLATTWELKWPRKGGVDEKAGERV
jgi:hypothetical protein